MQKKVTTHRANFLVSSFLMSTRHLKKCYGLNSDQKLILRYIADSIDISFEKTQRFQTTLSQSQIAKFCSLGLKTVWRCMQKLTRKRLIVYINNSKGILTLGRVLFAYVRVTYPLEVRQSDVPPRSTSHRRTSNSSNLTNKQNLFCKNQNQKQNQELKAVKKSKSTNLLTTENDMRDFNYTNPVDNLSKYKKLEEEKIEKSKEEMDEAAKTLDNIFNILGHHKKPLTGS